MNSVRLILGCCLALGFTPACSSNDTEGGTPAAAGSTGDSGGTAAGGDNTAGTAPAVAGTNSGGQTGSAGSNTAGSGGTNGDSAGSAGAAGSGGSGGSSSGEDELNCKKSGVGCLCTNIAPQPDSVGICSPQSVNGMCCEGNGFCSCRQWSCENDSLGCSCGSNTDGPLKKCSGTFGVCCLTVIGTASNCYCDDLLTECVGNNDVKVANCDIAIAPCGQGETEVDACKP